MMPNHDQSLEFLASWTENLVLVAISTDKKTVRTGTFKNTQEKEIRRWLKEYGSFNLYFTVNDTYPLEELSKPTRDNISQMTWLHVDIDPRVGEDITAEQERILALFENPPSSIPPPTYIVFSGGGYQGFWKLRDPVPINGREDLYEDAKRYNQTLELAFSADPCHNVDRIMRIPGTVNWPDKKKAEKGRVPALSSIVHHRPEAVYDIGQFIKAPAMQIAAEGLTSSTAVPVDIGVGGNVQRIDDINELDLPDVTKIIIVQGEDPYRPGRFPSRSEAIHYVCCEMVRREIPDDVIFSVITDPDFAISSRIREKGEKYAIRQIQRAKEVAIDPQLAALNEKFATVLVGNKYRVIMEKHDDNLNRSQLLKLSFEDFRNMHMNQRVKIGETKDGDDKLAPLGHWWLAHKNRRQYESIVFKPNVDTPNDYNMWRGFAYPPRPGSKHEKFLKHLLDNICSRDEKLYNYLITWMAMAIQKPGQPGQTAIVMRGDQGTGKGFLAKHFGRLFGRHYVAVSNAKHLTGNFNAHLRDCVLLFADEAFYAGDKAHAGVLKSIVTEDTLMIEPKGVDTEIVANCLHIIMASNEDWVVPAGINERRFCVIDVSSYRIQDTEYFGEIAADLETGGYENLLSYLLNYDLSQINVRDLPHTEALQTQKIHSFDAMQDWWYGKLLDGKLLPSHSDWTGRVYVDELLEDFTYYTRAFNMNRRGSAIRLGKFLRTAMPEENLVRVQTAETITVNDRTIRRPYAWHTPTLKNCRDWWDRKFGGPYHWPKHEVIKSRVEQTETIV